MNVVGDDILAHTGFPKQQHWAVVNCHLLCALHHIGQSKVRADNLFAAIFE